MQIEVMEHFGIKKYFRDADFFETDTAKRLFRQLKKIIPEGQLIALTGVVGIGKTTYLEKIQKQLVTFGLVNNVNTFNPIRITFMGWTAMLKDMKNSANYKESLKIFFGPPNTKTRSGSF